MTKTAKTKTPRTPDRLHPIERWARDLERVAVLADAAMRQPPGSVAQGRAMARTERALRALQRRTPGEAGPERA